MVELSNEKEKKIIGISEGFNNYRSWGGSGFWKFKEFNEND